MSMEDLKRLGTPKQQVAMRDLEALGFRFGVDFGYENAIERLRGIDQSIVDGNLYEHLSLTFGIQCQAGEKP